MQINQSLFPSMFFFAGLTACTYEFSGTDETIDPFPRSSPPPPPPPPSALAPAAPSSTACVGFNCVARIFDVDLRAVLFSVFVFVLMAFIIYKCCRMAVTCCRSS
ncbi:unnamed protein product [Caenorhabditis bovis]|uniref:Uncharacterized protein n=1 Tax=Caenorhabditis bovis TaxID=2654633 RepID=A0A8S1F959_9PELO|nr:unnamed protein product [Caenorhabditis bovis]